VVLNVFPLDDRPPAPVPAAAQGPRRLYWFSQTIGRDRGLEAIVRAIGALKPRDAELHLRGEWQAGFERELRAIAASAGVADRSLVWHAPAAPGEMVRLAAQFDVGLALETGRTPNADLALSNKIFTYLVAGVPVLASATSAQAALCTQLGTAAAVAAIDNAEQMAAKLRFWFDAPEVLAAARAEAWRLGEARFNWNLERQKVVEAARAALAPAPDVRAAAVFAS
jgi:glycosyltransferase involved in cell wall biosynthesis